MFVWHFNKEESQKVSSALNLNRPKEEGWWEANWKHPVDRGECTQAWCELWARQTDRWGGVKLKVSSWSKQTGGDRRLQKKSAGLAFWHLAHHQSLCEFAADEWERSRHQAFSLIKNLSQVSPLFGMKQVFMNDSMISPSPTRLSFSERVSCRPFYQSSTQYTYKIPRTSRECLFVDILGNRSALFKLKPAQMV